MSETNTQTQSTTPQQTQQNTQPQTQQNESPAFDYEKLASLITGKQSVTEDTVLKSYFKEQGLSAEEMKLAIGSFKEQKAKNTPNLAELQSNLSSERSARLRAELESKATLEAIRQGVDVKSIPYLLKMADFDGCADKDGNITAEKLTEAVKKVLDDIPALKAATDSGNSIQQIGGDGEQSGSANTSTGKPMPTKKWNRFNQL